MKATKLQLEAEKHIGVDKTGSHWYIVFVQTSSPEAFTMQFVIYYCNLLFIISWLIHIEIETHAKFMLNFL